LVDLVEAFPYHSEALIAPVLKDSEEFKRLIKNHTHLRRAATAFPKHAEALINPILTDPEEFKRLFENYGELKETAKVFPLHSDILGQETVENAVKAIEQRNADIKEVKKNARLLGILRRGTGSLFSEIPEEVANKIVSDTRDTKYLKDKEASDIFEQEYKNQPPKK
ncbi:hypothetical protein DIZ66_15690, partial [Legionella pneumophila]